MRRTSIIVIAIAIACAAAGAAVVGGWLGAVPWIGDGDESRTAAASAAQSQAAVMSATTAPDAKAATGRVVGRFAVWGDVRNDAGETAASPGFLALAEALAETRFAHSIVVGDYTYASGDHAADTARYDAFVDAAGPLLAGHATHFIVGNHERVEDPGDDALYHEKLWGEAAPGAPGGHRRHHWGAFSMTFGTKRVFAYYLSTGESTAVEGTIGFKTARVDRSEGSAWRTQSRQARDLVGWLKDRGRRQWVVIVVHHPLFDSKNDKPWDTTAFSSEKMKLVRLFRRYGVDLVLQGDVHNYRRHVQPDGTTYLTQGMGGASPKPDRYSAAEPLVPALDGADRSHLGSPGEGHLRYGWTTFAVLSTGKIRGSTYYVSTVDETAGGSVVQAGTRILFDRFTLTNVLRTAP